MLIGIKNLSSQANGWWFYDYTVKEKKFLTLDQWREYYSPECAVFKLAEVIDDIKGTEFAPNNLYLVYDGECPICTHAVREIRLIEEEINLIRVNAYKQQSHLLLITVIKSKELDLKDGMIIFYQRKLYQGNSVLEFLEEHGESTKVFQEHPNHSFV
jgi:hypothetical protein